MILIGIAGRSGAGKTSISNMLADELGCNVYHLDNLQHEVEEWKNSTFFKKFIITEEESGKKYVNPKLKGKTFDDDDVNHLYEQIKELALKSIIKKKTIEQKLKGANYFIIEGTQLGVYVPLNKIDIKIFMERSYNLRLRDIIVRDGITQENFKKREIYDEKKIKLYNDFEYVVKNEGTMQELEDEMKKVAFNIGKIRTKQMTL